jgi:hypothetical protein
MDAALVDDLEARVAEFEATLQTVLGCPPGVGRRNYPARRSSFIPDDNEGPMRRLRPILGISLVLSQFVVSCTSWQVKSVAPQALIETRQPKKVRVRTMAGIRVVMKNPHIQNDSMIGVVRGVVAGIPLARINQVAVRGFSPVKTLILILPPAALGLMCLIAGSECWSSSIAPSS